MNNITAIKEALEIMSSKLSKLNKACNIKTVKYTDLTEAFSTILGKNEFEKYCKILLSNYITYKES